MDDFIDECERENGKMEENNNKTQPVAPDGNQSDYTDLSGEEDGYGSEASTIKCADSPRSPPCVKKKTLIKKKKHKKNKKSKKNKKKNKNDDDSKEDGAGALVASNGDNGDGKTLIAGSHQASENVGDFDLFRTPEFICGMLHDSDGDFLYLVKWVNDGLEPTMDFVLAAFVNQRYNDLVIQFYDHLSERLLNGEWTVADYGNELYFFLNYDTPDPVTNDDDNDWTGGRTH